MQDRPPPVITITDPARPGPVVDQVGFDPDRPRRQWRPSRRVLRTALALQVVVLLLVPVTLSVRYHVHEDALDQQALQGIRLRLVDRDNLDASDPSTVSLLLRNAGTQPLEVLFAGVDRDGYARYPVGGRLAAGDLTRIDLPMEKQCPQRVPVSGPSGLLVTVRTVRGQQATVRVLTRSASFSDDYLFAQEDFCRLYTPGDSLQTRLLSSAFASRALLLRVGVGNASALPRTLAALHGPVGFAVSTSLPLPLALAPAAHGATSSLGLTVRLTVRSCGQAQLLPDQLLATENPTGTFLVAQVAGRDGTEEVPLYLGNELPALLGTLVATSC